MSEPTVEIKIGANLPSDQLMNLYNSVGWYAYTNEKRGHELQDAIRNTSFVVSAWIEDTLIGLARGLSDDSSIFFLQDILVIPEFQRRGIGRKLMNSCLKHYNHVRSIVLLTDNEDRQLQFYKSFGFKNTRDLDKSQINTFLLSDNIA